MVILIDKETKFLIQGITGKQGQVTCKSMIDYGSKVVAGVTPGKGGQEVEGVPVYNSIQEAKKFHEIDATILYVPPKLAKPAILEAIKNKIKLVVIITENIPVHDMAFCLAEAQNNNITVIGPSSIGIISPGKAKCGSIAGGESQRAFTKGNIGVISKSGGMSSETSLVIKQSGLGVSTAIGIGGDVLMGSAFKELVQLFEKDEETKAIAIYGEIGGTTEEDLADYLIKRKNKDPFLKPIVAFIAGDFAEGFHDISLGHAGAIIEGGKGTKESKIKALKEAGVIIAGMHHEMGNLIKAEIAKKEG